MYKLKEEQNQKKELTDQDISKDHLDHKANDQKPVKKEPKNKQKEDQDDGGKTKKDKDGDKKKPKKKTKKRKQSRSSSESDSSSSESKSSEESDEDGDTNSKMKKSESSQNSFTRFSNFYFGPQKKEELPSPQISPDGQFYLYAVPVSATSA
jgi:hypothetical protein